MTEYRVLVLAPTGADAQVAGAVLAEAQISSRTCASLADLCDAIDEGAGALLIAEEALPPLGPSVLAALLAQQPPWSDVPLIVLTSADTTGHTSYILAEELGLAGNLTLLERPFRVATFVSTIRAALRARRKQYEVRELVLNLGSSEERFRSAFAHAAVGMALTDPGGRILQVNEAFCRITGYAAGALLTLDLNSLTHPDDREKSRAPLASLLAGEIHSFVIEKRFVREDGGVIWVQNSLSLARDAAGRPANLIAISANVDDQKRYEAEREGLLASERAARAAAENASRMKDEFLATLSHELRTPLNAIVGWSQILQTSHDDQDLQEGLAVIARNARAQQQIIDDLLDMSRITSGKVRLDVQRVDLRAVIMAAIDTVRHAAEAKGVRLQPVLDTLAGPVSGDQNRLQQVFWNLLSNAIKFTPKAGRVQVVLGRVGSHLEVSVIDTGEGINPEFLPHVFDRFRQADGSTARRHGGLGIGLAIVKQLVELHGGTIGVMSKGAGQGATFTVSLPLSALQSETEPTLPRRYPTARPDFRPPANHPFSLHGVKVLVVDDELDARDLVRRLLEDRDAKVVTAASAAEALASLSRARPDVLVSDIGMPGEDGYSLIRRIRKLSPAEGGRTPALALTAYARSEDRTKAVDAGFQTHLAKPVQPSELLAAVASLAARAQMPLKLSDTSGLGGDSAG
jgi:PAS domain S-box-containing protein